jgi:hypothetical protein
VGFDLGQAHLSESDFAAILFPSDNARLVLLDDFGARQPARREGLNMALQTFYMASALGPRNLMKIF